MFTYNHTEWFQTYQEALANAPLELRNKIKWVSEDERISKLANKIASDNRDFSEVLS